MKILLKTVAVTALLILLGNSNASAEGFKFGVKGGVTFGELHFDKERSYLPYASRDERVGWNVGVTMQYIGNSGLGLDMSLLYARNEYGYWDHDHISKDMVDLPIHLVYHIPTSVNRIFSPYLYTGPDLMFGLNDKDRYYGDYYYDDYYYSPYRYSFKPARMVFSWNVGIGMMLFNHVQLQAGYTFGISNAFEDNSDTSYGKSRVWNVSAALVF